MTIDTTPITYILDWLSGKLLNADPHGEWDTEWKKISDASAALDAMTARIKALEEENARLHERLEDNRVFQLDDTGNMVRIDVEPGSIEDGIACRDETIRQLEEMRTEQSDRIKALEEALRNALVAIHDGASEAEYGDWKELLERRFHRD